MNGDDIGIAVWLLIVLGVYLLWLGSDMRKGDDRDHWDDE